ncbi:PilZ domain-containing protein [Geomonas anaerohicana]|uniref:PilZ domain-containing protein n=1 Tax=Geomonas anaerohicana TaxID=2798583 RepID=A0ABS0YDH0_9BACT|nr:PilZ domain-containing protein [Geomonas anaerohicana]MBJ6750343.1 PilZ domain-containing protein [Geomonas anaerohicana]
MKDASKILQFARPDIVIEVSPGSEKEVGLSKLINKLNFINFQEQSILVNFKHSKYPRTVTLEATPLPCLNNKLECRWVSVDSVEVKTNGCVFDSILVVSGHRMITAAPELISMSDEGATFLLPEKCTEVNYRKSRRYPCSDISAELFQNGARFEGMLVDFSAVSFRVHVPGDDSRNFNWINCEVPLQVVFSSGSTTLYSAECQIATQTPGQRSRIYVLEPVQSRMQRFKAKEIRSDRHELLPLPNAVFNHPFSQKSVDLKVLDLSGSGFSVSEDAELSVLLPGMIIPELELRIGNGFATKCTAQVVYRDGVQKDVKGATVRSGLCFLDMDIRDHVNLLSLLYLAKDKHSYVSTQVDLEDLWQFFFESGFIYPEKYHFFQTNKTLLKETYKRLYTENPSIARHYIYQEHGTILGHLAMLRFYQSSWLVHHHAANKSESLSAGLVVLNQLANSINDSYNLKSAYMDYIICYYRPDNKFPNRVFGGAAKAIGRKKGCSIDTFAYFHYHRTFSDDWNFSGPWSLTQTTREDLYELEAFYEQESGGVMLHALDLEPAMANQDQLAKEYDRAGLSLKRYQYTLKKNGDTKAIILVNISDIGLNLSDLTNCIHLIVLDQAQFPRDIVYILLSILTHKHQQNDIPVLAYPMSYVEAANLPYERKYALWAISSHEHASDFIKYINDMQTRHKTKRTHAAEHLESSE